MRRIRRDLRQTSVLGAVAALGLLATGGTAVAGPQDHTVIIGDVTITQNGDLWSITASNGSIVEYSSFDILLNEIVRFVQPSANARILNRITGPDPTSIAGQLISNGIVIFVNPAGVRFEGSSVLDVAGIYAAGGDISNDDFSGGLYKFTGVRGEVTIDAGAQITADTIAAFIGSRILNQGSVTVPDGIVAMVGTGPNNSQVTFMPIGGGKLSVRVDGSPAGAPGGGAFGPAVVNEGTIDAGMDGQVLLGAGDLASLAIRNAGTLIGGTVEMIANGGTVRHEGTIEAGDLLMSGDLIELAADVNADRSVFDGNMMLDAASITIAGRTGGQAESVILGGNVGVTGAGTDFTVDAASASLLGKQVDTGTGDQLWTGDVTVGNGRRFAGGSIQMDGTLTAGNNLRVRSRTGDITIDTLDAGNRARLDSVQNIDITTATVGDAARLTAGAGLDLGNATFGDDAQLTAGTALDVSGTLSLGDGATITGQSVNVDGALTAGDALSITSTNGDVTLDDVTAGDDASIVSSDVLSMADAAFGDDATLTAGTDVDVTGALGLGDGATITGETVNVDGTLNAGDGLSIDATVGDVTLDDVTAGDDATITSVNAVMMDDAAFGDNASLTAGDAVSVTGPLTVGDAATISGQTVDVNGTLTAGDDLSVDATGGDVTLDDVVADNTASVTASGAVTMGDATFGNDATVTANGGSVTALDVTAGSGLAITAGTGGAITLQDLAADDATLTASDGLVDLDSADITGALTITASGEIIVDGSLAAGGAATINANDDITLGSADVGDDSSIYSDTGAISVVNDLTVGGGSTVEAGTDLSVGGDFSATGNTVSLTAGDSITVDGSIVAQDGLSLATQSGDITTGDVVAGSGLVVDTASGNANITLGSVEADDATLDAGTGQVSLDSADIAGALDVDAGSVNVDGLLDVAGAATVDATVGDITLGSADLGEESQISAGGRIDVDGDFAVGEDSIVFAQGADLSDTERAIDIDGDLTLGAGSWMATENTLDASVDIAGSATLSDVTMITAGNRLDIGGDLDTSGSVELISGTGVDIDGTTTIAGGGTLDVYVIDSDGSEVRARFGDGIALGNGATLNVDAMNVLVETDGTGDAITFAGDGRVLIDGTAGLAADKVSIEGDVSGSGTGDLLRINGDALATNDASLGTAEVTFSGNVDHVGLDLEVAGDATLEGGLYRTRTQQWAGDVTLDGASLGPNTEVVMVGSESLVFLESLFADPASGIASVQLVSGALAIGDGVDADGGLGDEVDLGAMADLSIASPVTAVDAHRIAAKRQTWNGALDAASDLQLVATEGVSVSGDLTVAGDLSIEDGLGGSAGDIALGGDVNVGDLMIVGDGVAIAGGLDADSADVTATDAAFSDVVNVDGDLRVDAATTRFDGRVDAGSLEVTGITRLGTDRVTVDTTMTWGDTVFVEFDGTTTFDAGETGTISFGNGLGRGGAAGAAADVDILGDLTIQGDVDLDSMLVEGDTTLSGDSDFTMAGSDLPNRAALEFRGMVDALGGAGLRIAAGPGGFIVFREDVGSTGALGSLDLTGGAGAAALFRDGTVVRADAISFDFAGSGDVATVWTVGADGFDFSSGTGDLVFELGGGTFTMSGADIINTSGGLSILDAGNVVLNDVNSTGLMTVDSDAIELFAGSDFVSLVGFDFSVAPTWTATGNAADLPIFGTPDGDADLSGLAALAGFRIVAFSNDFDAASFGFGLDVPDLLAIGPSNQDVSRGLAGSLPQQAESAPVDSPSTLGAAAEAALRRIGLRLRNLKPSEAAALADGSAILDEPLPLTAVADGPLPPRAIRRYVNEILVDVAERWSRVAEFDAEAEAEAAADGEATGGSVPIGAQIDAMSDRSTTAEELAARLRGPEGDEVVEVRELLIVVAYIEDRLKSAGLAEVEVESAVVAMLGEGSANPSRARFTLRDLYDAWRSSEPAPEVMVPLPAAPRPVVVDDDMSAG